MMEEGGINCGQIPFQKKISWKSFFFLNRAESTEANVHVTALSWSEKGHIKSPLSSIIRGARENTRTSQDSLWEAVRAIWNVKYESQRSRRLWPTRHRDQDNWWFHLPRNP